MKGNLYTRIKGFCSAFTTLRAAGSGAGFTFIEVLVAMLIFVVAVIVAAGIVQGSVRATREAKEITTATWLLQNTMVELETKLETEGFDKGCDKKKEAKFASPYQDFTWTTYCYEIDFQLSQTAANLAKAQEKGEDSDNHEDVIQKMILDIASSYISKSLREITGEVTWMQGKMKRKISATTQIVRYDQPLQFPSFGGGSTQSTPQTPQPATQ